MAITIEELLAQSVRSAVRESVAEEVRPAVTAAVKDAIGEPGRGPAGAAYISVKEAARIMSAHPATVRKLIAEGKLGRYSVEGQHRVKVGDIHAYMGREGPASPTISLDETALQIIAQHGAKNR
jgi:excisionase family DNA binding protein